MTVRKISIKVLTWFVCFAAVAALALPLVLGFEDGAKRGFPLLALAGLAALLVNKLDKDDYQ